MYRSCKYLGSVITDEGSKPEILSRIAQNKERKKLNEAIYLFPVEFIPTSWNTKKTKAALMVKLEALISYQCSECLGPSKAGRRGVEVGLRVGGGKGGKGYPCIKFYL